MEPRRSRWRTALWGACGGVVAGVVGALLHYWYEQATSPNPYNVLTLFLLAPVLAILGAMAGLLAAAWYSSD